MLLDDGPIPPGSEGFVQLVLDQPIGRSAETGSSLRDTTAQRTIGGGKFLDLRAPARRRRTPERHAQLEAHALREPKQILSALLEHAPFYVDLSSFARDRALSAEDPEACWSDAIRSSSQTSNAVLAISAPPCSTQKRCLAGDFGEVSQPTILMFPASGWSGSEFSCKQTTAHARVPVVPSKAGKIGRDVALDGAWVRLSSTRSS